MTSCIIFRLFLYNSIFLLCLFVRAVECDVTLTGGQLAGIIIGCILGAIVLTVAFCILAWFMWRKHTKAQMKKNVLVYKGDAYQGNKQVPSGILTNQFDAQTTNLSKIKSKDVIRIPTKHKKITDLGFNLYGNHKEGVFLKDLEKDKFQENVNLNNGDKLIGLEFDVKTMSFIDAFTLLNRILPYTDALTLVVQKKYGKGINPNVVSLRMSQNKTKRSNSLMDTTIGRSYGSYRRKFSTKNRPKNQLNRKFSKEQNPNTNQLHPPVTRTQAQNQGTKIVVGDSDTASKVSSDRFEDLSNIEKLDLVRLSYESPDKTQSTPNLMTPLELKAALDETDSNGLDLTLREPSEQPAAEHQTVTKASSDISHLKDGYNNERSLTRIVPQPLHEADSDDPSMKFVPASQHFLPDYEALRNLEDKYNIDVEDYEKLLYFEHLLAIQHENLKSFGINVPPSPVIETPKLSPVPKSM